MESCNRKYGRSGAAMCWTAGLAALALSGCDVFESNPFGSKKGRTSWQVVTGPCSGSTTGALWFDNDNDGYIGCGENAEGTGLHVTTNGGTSWREDPAFQLYRVNDVRRGGPDRTLVLAGLNPRGGHSAWKVAESAFRVPEPLFTPSSDSTVAVAQAGQIAIAEDAYTVVTSLTGNTAAAGFLGVGLSELADLAAPDAAPFKVRRVVAHAGRFHGVGGVINEPAMVLLPSRRDGAPRHELESFELQSSSEDGELTDIHVFSGTRMLVVGRDQGTNALLAYHCDGDPWQMSSWTRVDFASQGIAFTGTIQGIAVRGERVVAVGAKQPGSAGGFMLTSNDGGKTFTEVNPPGVAIRPLSRVWLFEDGTIVAAGGSNHVLLSPTAFFP